jgi:spore maturation protein CgeB
LRELQVLGVEVSIFEEEDSWSATRLVQEHGVGALENFPTHYPDLRPRKYSIRTDLEAIIATHDVVVVHEWTPHWLVERLANLRSRYGSCRLLFHDTHHRIISGPETLPLSALEDFDAVIAFGEVLADAYRSNGFRAFVLHEAADLVHFKPHKSPRREGFVWIGNWGDDERSQEISDYLVKPAHQIRASLDLYGVRYPDAAITFLQKHGAEYRGWCANADAPKIYSYYCATIHIPRNFYVDHLPGIPTIRVFEALACGIPLLCSPWDDAEYLFRPGRDYLVANSPKQMTCLMRDVMQDGALRQSLIENGLYQIHARHSCWHRAHELIAIIDQMNAPALQEQLS